MAFQYVLKEAVENGADNGRSKGKEVVIAGESADSSVGREFQNHGQGVDVDESPANPSGYEQGLYQPLLGRARIGRKSRQMPARPSRIVRLRPIF